MLSRWPPSFSWQKPSALKELYLNHVYVDKFWLGLLSRELTSIAAVVFDDCIIYGDNEWEEVELESMETLK